MDLLLLRCWANKPAQPGVRVPDLDASDCRQPRPAATVHAHTYALFWIGTLVRSPEGLRRKGSGTSYVRSFRGLDAGRHMLCAWSRLDGTTDQLFRALAGADSWIVLADLQFRHRTGDDRKLAETTCNQKTCSGLAKMRGCPRISRVTPALWLLQGLDHAVSRERWRTIGPSM